MNSSVLVSFAPVSSLISFTLPPEGARSPDLSPEPGRVPTRAGRGRAETQATPATGQWKAGRLLLLPLVLAPPCSVYFQAAARTVCTQRMVKQPRNP